MLTSSVSFQPQLLQQQQAALMMASQGGSAAAFINPNLAIAAPHPALAAVPNGLTSGTLTPTTSGERAREICYPCLLLSVVNSQSSLSS